MPDPYAPLPADDESIDVLTGEHDDYLRAAIPGWAPSAGALEVAERAAFADEASTLYALLRERADDEWRDYGADVLGIIPAGDVPASASTTWTARDTLGHTIDAGTVIIIDAPEGRFAFEAVYETTIPAASDEATGVLVQATEQYTGTQTNGVTGTVIFDEQPSWVLSVTFDAPASGGTDAEDDTDYLNRIKRAALLLSRAPILPGDFELVAQEVAGVARALVLDGYDDTDDTSDNERTVSVYPVTDEGLAVSGPTKTAIQALIEERREVNWIVRVADPDYTTVNVDITVSALEDADSATVDAAVQEAIEQGPLNPALWGDTASGERQTWKLRTWIRRYEIAATADRVGGVYDVTEVKLSTGADPTADADVELTGPAPLPLAGTVNVTVVAPT